jgi:hypothetical protein
MQLHLEDKGGSSSRSSSSRGWLNPAQRLPPGPTGSPNKCWGTTGVKTKATSAAVGGLEPPSLKPGLRKRSHGELAEEWLAIVSARRPGWLPSFLRLASLGGALLGLLGSCVAPTKIDVARLRAANPLHTKIDEYFVSFTRPFGSFACSSWALHAPWARTRSPREFYTPLWLVLVLLVGVTRPLGSFSYSSWALHAPWARSRTPREFYTPLGLVLHCANP